MRKITLMLESNFHLMDRKFIECCIAVWNVANFPIRRKNQLCACLIYACPYLHAALKRHLIKIRIFVKKIDKEKKNTNSQDVLKGLDSTKFLEILKSNTTPHKFSADQLKITFKRPNFVREPL